MDSANIMVVVFLWAPEATEDTISIGFFGSRMEGLVCSTLRHFARKNPAGAPELHKDCLRPLLSLVDDDRVKRRRLREAASFTDGWGPWSVWAATLRTLFPTIDTEHVCTQLFRPAVVAVGSSDSDSSDADDTPEARRTIARGNARADALEAELALCKRKLAASQRMLRRLKSASKQLQRSHRDELAKVVLRGAAHRYFAPLAGMTLAAKRMASGTSARRLGIILSLDVDKSTVVRWELWFATALQAWRRSWHTEHQHFFEITHRRWSSAASISNMALRCSHS